MRLQLVIAVLAAFTWFGCSDSSTSDNSNSNLTGDLTGRITLADYRGYPKVDKSGVLVQCDGTSYSAITDTSGAWTIHNLPSRTYSLTFSKEGCDTWKDRSYSFLGGGTVRYKYTYLDHGTPLFGLAVPIRELPHYRILLDAVVMPKTIHSDSTNSNIFVKGSIFGHTSDDAPANVQLSVYIITSTTSSLSLDNPSSFKNSYYFSLYTYNNFDFSNHSSKDTTANLTIQDFQSLYKNFSSGDTIYFRAYPGIGFDSYYDAIENKTIAIGYSSNGSNILSAIMP